MTVRAPAKKDCTCHGDRKKKCRKGRPLCRARRRLSPRWTLCDCGFYGFVHRKGSGRCQDGGPLYLAWCAEQARLAAEAGR